jgi:uncharacterized membrane-anchored protein YitT (DUF2179 family)
VFELILFAKIFSMKQKLVKEVKSYIMITAGLAIFVFAWVGFLIPSEIVGGGVTGLAAIVYYATSLNVGYTYLAINGVLVLLALKILGARFAVSTIYGIGIGSLMFMILPEFIENALVEDQFMNALLGASLSGIGIGIAISNGGNSGGTDIIALIINKYKNISLGRIILYIDVGIIGSSYFITQSVEKLVYGYVVMAVFAYVLDIIISGSNQSFQFMIITKKPEVIASRISKEIKRGITVMNAYGWFSKSETTVLIVIARKSDKPLIMKIIKESDEHSFISVAKVQGVFGENFDKIKL